MRPFAFASSALFLALLAIPAVAQSDASSDKAGERALNSAAARQARHQPPCWKQAGIAPNLVNERWKLEDQGKARIAAVCTETGTSAQQKQTKIQMINTETQHAIAGIIPAKQLQAFNACQANYASTHPKPASEKELGPCGGVIPGSAAEESAAMDHMNH